MAAAAAAVASKHKVMASGIGASAGESATEMPLAEACIMSGTLGRQVFGTLGVMWQDRTISLTADRLWVGKMEGKEVLDFIPLVEVKRIKTNKAQPPGADRKASFIGLSKSTRSKASQHLEGSYRDLKDLHNTAAGLLVDSKNHQSPHSGPLDDHEEDDPERMFAVQTIEGGNNSGKTTVLQAQSEKECERWVAALEEAVAQENKRVQREADLARTPWRRFRDRASVFYASNITQCCVGMIILASYFTAMYQSQTLPAAGSSTANSLYVLEWIFTMLFLLELIVNMVAHWFWKFFQDPWNTFDFVVVIVSLLGLGVDDLPAINVLRLIRVFKILRLFRKLTSLRILITALVSSIIPVLNSMVILMLFTSMYAIVATDLFHSRCDEFFGDFSRSLYTLFQVATMDAWSSIVTRTLLEEFEGYWKAWVSLFFVSYVLLVGLVLMNIVVAVLLDEFISTVAKEKAEKRQRQLQELQELKHDDGTPEGPLDPLVRSLMIYTNQDDLMRRISNLYARLDLDESGAIDLDELNEGLKKIPATEKLILSQDDFNIVTNNRALLNGEGELTPAAFEVMMLTQVKSFSQRKLVSAMARDHDEDTDDLVFALKSIMSTLDHVDGTIATTHGMEAHKPYLRSRKEILNKLFKSSQITMFGRWKEAYYKSIEDAESGSREDGAAERGLAALGGRPFGTAASVQVSSAGGAGAAGWSSTEGSALPSMEISSKLAQQDDLLHQVLDAERRREREEKKRHSALDARQAELEKELQALRSDQEATMADLGAKLDVITKVLLHGNVSGFRIEKILETSADPTKSGTLYGKQDAVAYYPADASQAQVQAQIKCSPHSQQRLASPRQVADSRCVSGARETVEHPIDRSGTLSHRSSSGNPDRPGYATQPLSISLWQAQSLDSTPSEPRSPVEAGEEDGQRVFCDAIDSFKRVPLAQSKETANSLEKRVAQAADSLERQVFLAQNPATTRREIQSNATTLDSERPYSVKSLPAVRDWRACILGGTDCVACTQQAFDSQEQTSWVLILEAVEQSQVKKTHPNAHLLASGNDLVLSSPLASPTKKLDTLGGSGEDMQGEDARGGQPSPIQHPERNVPHRNLGQLKSQLDAYLRRGSRDPTSD